MKVLILQPLPGSIGGLPPGEAFVPGAVHTVPDDIGGLFLREGWARRAPEIAAASDATASDAAVSDAAVSDAAGPPLPMPPGRRRKTGNRPDRPRNRPS